MKPHIHKIFSHCLHENPSCMSFVYTCSPKPVFHYISKSAPCSLIMFTYSVDTLSKFLNLYDIPNQKELKRAFEEIEI